jgi:hypothetical protein
LLTAITSARPRSATMPRSVASCSATVARIQHADHDVRVVDRLQRLDDVTILETVVHARRRRTPAVSISTYCRPSRFERHVHGVARVPGWSNVIRRPRRRAG